MLAKTYQNLPIDTSSEQVASGRARIDDKEGRGLSIARSLVFSVAVAMLSICIADCMLCAYLKSVRL